MDYCVNYYNPSSNDHSKYENFDINLTDYLKEGYILPNLKIRSDSSGNITIRDFLRSLISKECTFFVLKNISTEMKENEISIFEGEIPLNAFQFKLICFSLTEKPCDVVFESNEELMRNLSNISCLIIRPDFIIDKIIKI